MVCVSQFETTQRGSPGERWEATDGISRLIVDPIDDTERARISKRHFQHVSVRGGNQSHQSIVFGELDGVRCYVIDEKIILTRKTINLDPPQ